MSAVVFKLSCTLNALVEEVRQFSRYARAAQNRRIFEKNDNQIADFRIIVGYSKKLPQYQQSFSTTAEQATPGVRVKTFLPRETALLYWRIHFSLDSELELAARVSGAEDCASRKKDVVESMPEGFAIPGSPIDALVFNEGHRRRSDSVTCHAWQTRLPNDSFYRARGAHYNTRHGSTRWGLFARAKRPLPVSWQDEALLNEGANAAEHRGERHFATG